MKEIDRQEEQLYLDLTLKLLLDVINEAKISEVEGEKEFNIENQKYLESMKDMDLNTLSEETELAVAHMQTSLEQKVYEINKLKKEVEIFKKMQSSPYFAKIDILPEDSKKIEKYYIGMHTLNDKENNFIVLDWRSPIASVFYDYQVGKAKILSDSSELEVELKNKRQFKIEEGELKYFFDTNITIEDELLKDALGQNSSNQMKNIVQTIQSEQNQIIRSSEHCHLVVNGVAGSGKTAIALHRIAYLLYKLKGRLNSDSILIASQNNAFSSYISAVLPELAEQDVNKIILDVLCKKQLSKIANIENKYEQMDRVIGSEAQREIWKRKTSLDFFEKLDTYCKNDIVKLFNPKSITVMGVIIPKEKISKLYFEMYSDKSLFTRICWISEALVEDYFYNVKNASAMKRLKIEIFEKLYSFVLNNKPVSLYLEFLKQNGLSMSLRGDRIKNEDAYAIWYIRMFVLGYKANENVKHLIVDEMQEYSALQVKILHMLYPCTKTFLGDYLQNIESVGAEVTINNYNNILGENVKFIQLNKSYRSTMQITKLFSKLAGIDNIEFVKRSGDEVGFYCTQENNETKLIKKLIKQNYGFNTIALLTKTNKQAQFLYKKLKQEKVPVSLINSEQDVLKGKINILSAYNSKGLEFDYVIVCDASSSNYVNGYDKNLLFICVSRAMHKLDIIAKDKFCKFLKDEEEKND